MRLDHRAELQQIDKEPSEGGGQAMKLATNADVVDKPVRVKFATQPSDPELRAYRAEVAATLNSAFINFRVGGSEISGTSSSKLGCYAPGALDANDGAAKEEAHVPMQRGGRSSSSFGYHAQNPRW